MTGATREQVTLSRRNFLRTASAGAAACAMPTALQALAGSALQARGLACVAGEETLRMLRSTGERFTQVASVACEAPGALAMHPSQDLLYVAHGTDWHQHRPAGSISSYRLDRATGELALLRREGLSLACRRPNGLAVSQDGKLLVVASESARILNLLQLSSDGVAEPVTVAYKDLRWPEAGTGEGVPLTMRFVASGVLKIQEVSSFPDRTYRCTETGIELLSESAVQIAPASDSFKSLAAQAGNGALSRAGHLRGSEIILWV